MAAYLKVGSWLQVMAPYLIVIIFMVVIFYILRNLQNTALLLRELEACIPNSEIRDRMHVELKKIIPEAVGRDFTDIIVVHEDRKEPSILHCTSA